MLGRHGFGSHRDQSQPYGEFQPTGKFGKMFTKLSALIPSPESLTELGNGMLDAMPDDPAGDNNDVPAGYTYLGQFIDHDITFDPTSLQEKLVDPSGLRNFRTPMLDLDCLYGSGPADQPYLYQRDDRELFQIGKTSGSDLLVYSS